MTTYDETSKKREHEVIPDTWPNPFDPDAVSAAGRLLKGYPITEEERIAFLQSKKRIGKILGIEKYRDYTIIAEIVESTACIAGHRRGDRFCFDSKGCLLAERTKGPVCARLLNKIWYRLIMIMDRMADGTADYIGNGTFEGELPEVRMTCYGADFPYGDCGQVLMKVTVEKET
ncbi:MAG: hypothetical protein JW743_10870 [Deltaproteobacteria bacterium]|nr:hypothetical protein [Deltaproteobacteria bacterium]